MDIEMNPGKIETVPIKDRRESKAKRPARKFPLGLDDGSDPERMMELKYAKMIQREQAYAVEEKDPAGKVIAVTILNKNDNTPLYFMDEKNLNKAKTKWWIQNHAEEK